MPQPLRILNTVANDWQPQAVNMVSRPV